jgi:hypothetical protein
MTTLNLQRNTEVYVSTVDLAAGASAADMTSTNTWRVEVLAGYAASQSSATQDITSLESGLNPDRSTQRFNTAINPTEWNFQTYLRPTGLVSTVSASGNVKPLADWFLWQGLMSNTLAAIGVGSGAVQRSTWQDNGTFSTAARAGTSNVSPHTSNFATAPEYDIYLKMDNVFYQIKNATVNEASVDAAIDGIATTSWSGFGTNFIELTGSARDNLIQATTSANGVSSATVTSSRHHQWANNSGVAAAFIRNRLSSIDLRHTPSGGSVSNYQFPVTGLGITYNNNISYLTPEEIAALNSPIGQFTGSKSITGNFTAYLRGGTDTSSQFLRNIVADSRTSIAQVSNANLRVGGTTAPFVAFNMPAVQFNFPTHSIEDVIGLSVEFLAQEPTATRGTGSELTMFVSGVS